MKTRIREWRLSPVAAALVLYVAIAANAPTNTEAQELFQCPRGKRKSEKSNSKKALRD